MSTQMSTQAILTFTSSDGKNHGKLEQWLNDFFPKIKKPTSVKHEVSAKLLAVLIVFCVVYGLTQTALILNFQRRRRLGLALYPLPTAAIYYHHRTLWCVHAHTSK